MHQLPQAMWSGPCGMNKRMNDGDHHPAPVSCKAARAAPPPPDPQCILGSQRRVWGKQGPGGFFGRSPRPARCSAAAQGELFLIRKSFAHVASSVWNAHPLSASLAAHDQQEKERLLPALKSALSPKGTGGPSSKRPIMVPFSCEAGSVTLPHFTNLSRFSTLCQSRD